VRNFTRALTVTSAVVRSAQALWRGRGGMFRNLNTFAQAKVE
jgi:hypothetical protein